MSDLRLDYCSHEAARYSVMRWHYSRRMPKAKLVRIGVWENEMFRGAIIFGVGANRHLASQFGLEAIEACELTRVALAPGREHPTSKCIAISLKLLKRQSPGLRVVVSFADTAQGHLGIVYQATNWAFLGTTEQSYFKIHGRVVHPRTVYDRFGRGGQSISWLREHVDPNADRVEMSSKLRYAFALDRAMRRQLESIAQPYPRRGRSDTSDTPGDPPGEGGATPTRPLHSTTASTS